MRPYLFLAASLLAILGGMAMLQSSEATPAVALDVDFLQHAAIDDRTAPLVGPDVEQYLGLRVCAHAVTASCTAGCQTGTPDSASSAAVSNSGNPMTPE